MPRDVLPGTNFLSRAREGILEAHAAGAVHWAVSVLCIQGSGIVAQLVLGRLLSPADFGTVRTTEAALSVLSIPAGLGIGSAAARSAATAGKENLPAVLGNAVLLVFASSAAAAILAMACSKLVLSDSASALAAYLPLLAPTLALAAVTRVILAFRQGRLELRTTAIQSALPAICMIPALVLLVRALGLTGWVVTRNLIEAATLGLVLYSIRRGISLRWRWSIVRSLLSYGSVALLALLLGRAFSSGDILILNQMVPDSGLVGSYGAATLLASTILLPAAAINMVGFVQFARAGGDRSQLIARLKTVVAASIAVTLPLALALTACASGVIRGVFGTGYALPGDVVPLLAAAGVIECVLSSLGTCLFAVDRPSGAVFSNLLGVLFLGLLGLALIPAMGVRGAALAALLGNVLRLCVFSVAVWRCLRRGMA